MLELVAVPIDSEPKEITNLLHQIKQGNSQAEAALAPLIYKQLHQLAKSHMRRERPGHTLQPTALVHEAYVRLLGENGADWTDRSHFFAVAASIMRRLLIDYARSRKAQKRGGEQPVVAFNDAIEHGQSESWDNILAVHEALTRLAELAARPARVVELKFFAGLDSPEVAEVLGVSERTVKRDWRFAQAWLYKQMSASSDFGRTVPCGSPKSHSEAV